jgi:hypothetical protein
MNTPAMNGLKVRSVLMLSGTLMPESFPLHLKPYWKAWRLIGNSDAHTLDRDARRAGWSFFFIKGTVQAYMLGSGTEGTLRRAMRRIFAKVKSSGFNCLEVSEVIVSRFLGIPYVRVTAHSRHFQRSNMLEPLMQRSRTIAAAAWSVG